MSVIVPLETAPDAVKDLVARVATEPIVFTRGDQPVATLWASTSEAPDSAQPKRRQLGLLKGWLTVIEEDDEHLKDFKEYMP
ncbi:hypothetical protein [Botrimarina sp.]|uniref:hypothetical protein n=1 Tax=Botrimarina sp. TaxID=2795802 RepID=UPI0032EB7BD3